MREINSALRDTVESVANERGIDPEIVFDALAQAMASAIRKKSGKDIDVVVTIDHTANCFNAIRRQEVVADDAEIEFPDQQITLTEAKETHPELEVGQFIEEGIDDQDFGRIDAQTAKQVIFQTIRRAVRERTVSEFSSRVGELLTGVVKQSNREQIIIDIGSNVEAVILNKDTIPREPVRVGERIRAYLYDVRAEVRGPQLFASRAHPQMLAKLFEIEVPEINEEVIEVKSAARDPGARAKITVKTNDGRIDPIGACVGMRGSRVQAVSSELNGERIDIVLWDDNPAQLVINAMAPAEVESIVVDEDSRSMDIAVNEDQLAQAIGRSGQNIKLATDLTGWTLNVMTVADAEVKAAQESKETIAIFVEELGVDEDVAQGLIDEGFASLDEVALVAPEELLKVEGFDEDIVAELQKRANDSLLTKALVGGVAAAPAEDLLALEGMTSDIANALAAQGIVTREDLAEQAIDDITEIEGLNDELAGQLIMKARAHWFSEDEANT